MSRLVLVTLLVFAAGSAAAEPSKLFAPSPRSVKARRAVGITLTLLGAGMSLAGSIVASRAYQLGGGETLADRATNSGLGGLIAGTALVGIGSGLWGSTSYEDDSYRHGLHVAGAVLTASGLTAIASGAAALASLPSCIGTGWADSCSLGNVFLGGTALGLGALEAAIGIPLLIKARINDQPVVRLDTLGPVALRGGGGLAVSGRF
jgi:hypothetical protein